jgi:uncharacterized protein YkwD
MRRSVVLAGTVAFAAVGASVALAVTANAATATYEAEAAGNILSGGAAVATCDACSGGKRVRNVGKGATGDGAGVLAFVVKADAAGAAKVTISYTSSEKRAARLSVNGGAEKTVSFPGTGGFSRVGTRTTTVTLKAGANTLRFSNPGAWAPHFDKITVSATTPAPSEPTPTPTPTPSQAPAPGGEAGMEAEVVTLVNAERAKKPNCPALNVDARLATAARKHSADMAARGYFDHTSPAGVDFASRITREGYKWAGAGENIAKGQRDARAVMDAWMNSDGHRQNILNCGYRDIGVGLAYDAKKTPLWTQDFASPR